MKLKQGHCVATDAITEENFQKVIDAFRMSGCKINAFFNAQNVKYFSFLEWHLDALCKTNEISNFDLLLTVEQVIGADEKPHFEFSRTPNSESKLMADLEHIKMMTGHGKSRYVHGCYTEQDAKNVIAHFNANPQFTKELRIKSYKQSGSDVYIFYNKRTANDWHERGELPPVNLQCMRNDHVVQIVAHMFNGESKYAAFQHVDGNGCGYAEPSFFRPLKSERERAIEEMLKLDCHPQEGMLSRHDFCGALYDAGFRKEGK